MLGHARVLPRRAGRTVVFVSCFSLPFLFAAMPTNAFAQTDSDAGAPAPSTTSASPNAPPASSTTPPSGGPGAGQSNGGSGAPRGSLMPPSGGGAAGNGMPGGGLTMSPQMTGAAGSTGTQTPVVDPAGDARELANQGRERPSNDGSVGARPGDVYSEDWWGKTRPILELHGYFRVRGEVLHNFFLGRHDAPGTDRQNLWPQPVDNSYVDTSGTPHNVALCGEAANQPCFNKTQASANMRFRINPELHISDNLRIVSQIDALDNLVLGSTPESYAIQPSSKGGYGPSGTGYNRYAPLGAYSNTQGPPTAGVNGTRNSIDVKRAWAEYMTPVGQLRFGRMPNHWGLGMVNNSGDGIDADYHTTSDRIMFVSGIKAVDLYFGGAWDFVSTGNTTSQTPYNLNGGQSYNTANLTNVNQWTLFLARRMNPDLQRLALARGDIVINGGIYAVYRSQLLDVTAGQTPITGIDPSAANNGLERRGAQAFIPDPWIQILWKKFRFEAEFAAVYGELERSPQNSGLSTHIRQYGLATQTEFKAIEDKLRLQFGFGWASGDPWNESLNPSSNGVTPELNGGRGPISTFRFNPAYQVDLIFFRKIMTRVEGAYYLKPSVEYDFLRNPNGQKFGGGAAIIWSRASEFVQTPGHKRDLGVELDLSLYYQAKDGTLNDDPEKVGGFFAMLQYGVFFPLGGLSYMPGEQDLNKLSNWETSSAQTIRLFLGVVY